MAESIGDAENAATTDNRHCGWVFRGLAEFEARAATLLAPGLPRNEQLMVITDDPNPGQWPSALVASGMLRIGSTSEVYGSNRLVDVETQRAVFGALRDEAAERGFAGLRVAADNTSLIVTPERALAWFGWEVEADRWTADNAVTLVCGFDQTAVTLDQVSQVLAFHRTVVTAADLTH